VWLVNCQRWFWLISVRVPHARSWEQSSPWVACGMKVLQTTSDSSALCGGRCSWVVSRYMCAAFAVEVCRPLNFESASVRSFHHWSAYASAALCYLRSAVSLHPQMQFIGDGPNTWYCLSYWLLQTVQITTCDILLLAVKAFKLIVVFQRLLAFTQR